MLALFSLPLPAMAMFSDAAGVNYVLNSNGENTRGAIIPDQRVNAAVPDSITLNFTEYELHVGESFQLIATIWPDSLSARVNLEWSSRNQSVAEVNSNGVVTAVGVGSSVVSVICGAVRATCEITVKENEVLAQAVELTPESAELEVGETFSLAATIYPENTTDKSLAWSSSDAAVASVDENGVVTAVAVGSCVITATCGEVAGTCAITVKNPVIPADCIVLTPDNAVIEVGDILEITATVYPENATESRLTWRSSDENVATVHEHGHRNATVTALNPGECTITAECYSPNGVIMGSASITVKIHEVLADSVVLNLNSAMLELGEELRLIATVYPEDVTETLTWQSSNEDVATVDENGVVTAVAVGSCVITATCGEVAGTCAITVKTPVIPADYIVLTPDSAVIEVGDILEITATVYPENATESRLTWRSSDENVATVHEHGHRNATVTALNPGECTITAECFSPNGLIMGSASITVRIHEILADSVVLNLDSAMLAIGEELPLIATVYPEDVTEALTWQSSNEDVAAVGENGVVMAVATGECDVTATCSGISSSCHIQVYDPADVVITFDCEEARVVLNHEVVLTPSVSLPVRGGLSVISSDTTVVSAKVDNGKVMLSGVGFGKATVSVSSLDGLARPDTCDVVVSTLMGDVDFDGNLTINDLTGLIDYMLSGGTRADTYYFDVFSDGQINVSDLTELIDILLSGDEGVFVIVLESVSLSLESAEINLGGSVVLEALVLPEDVTNNFTSWTSTDESVAKVSDGVVSAVGVGECSIMVMCKDQAATCRIEVHETMPEKVVLDQDNLSMLPGQTMTLTATVYPENTTNKNVTWSSTNRNVAEVVDGKVTAVAVGDCYIIADCQGVRDTCAVNVHVVMPESVVLDQHSVSLLPGASVALTATVYPENTTNNTVTWTSTDRNVAEVEDGKVTAVAVGDCFIIADCQGVRDTCSVNVHVVMPESVVLDQHSVSLLPGASVALTATVYPENTTNNTVTWTSTDRNVAEVVDGKVTAVAVGDCYIIADCQGVRDTCSVNVHAVMPESVVLSEHSVSLLPGASVALTATVYPENTTNNAVTWTSTDRNVAEVEDGKVTAVAVGDCFIIADCQGVRDTCSVNVQAVAPESVVLSQHSVSLLPGASVALTATVYPENTTNNNVTWSSTNRNVASVVDGKVTAVAVGDCFIIADCQGVRDTCSVNVHVVMPESVVLSEHSVSLLPGASVALTATVYPENTTNNTVTWTSTDRNVAEVVDGKVTAVAVGDCFIIADCQGVSDTCSVTVQAVVPESIELSQSNVTMNPGTTITLTATVYPSNTTNKTVTWRSSKTTVATVTNGVVKAVAAGECDIIATCQNVQATCHVTVKEVNSNDNTITVNGVTFSMVPVEGGTFLMGTPATQTGSGTNERPQHFVTVSDYKIGQTEVTQELWVAVMGSNPSAFPGDPQRPVDNVSWEMCQEFIDSLNRLTGMNFRFPTEAEWEFAAKGGNQSKGYIFAGSNTPAPVAWYSTNSGSKTQPVAQKEANELGLYDMSGNVCEWCSDWYVSYESYSSASSEPVVNPTGPATGSYKMLRGGSWFEVAKCCRSGYRNMQTVTIRREFIGMRLAM